MEDHTPFRAAELELKISTLAAVQWTVVKSANAGSSVDGFGPSGKKGLACIFLI